MPLFLAYGEGEGDGLSFGLWFGLSQNKPTGFVWVSFGLWLGFRLGSPFKAPSKGIPVSATMQAMEM
jgi:hypothetical protein